MRSSAAANFSTVCVSLEFRSAPRIAESPLSTHGRLSGSMREAERESCYNVLNQYVDA
jgi:hypothetical protein